jgi:hypothetical protein
MHELDAVALTEPVPALGLARGEAGTIVDEVAPGMFDVEFSDDTGEAYAIATLPATQLIRLHYRRHEARRKSLGASR